MKYWKDEHAIGLTVGWHRRLVFRFQYRSYETDSRWLGFVVNWYNGRGWDNVISLCQN